MPQRSRGGEERVSVRSAAAARKGPAATSRNSGLGEAILDLFEEWSVRGPFPVPETRCRMDGRGHTQALQLGPQRIVEGMRKIAALDKHRAQKSRAKTRDRRDPPQLL